MFVLTACAPAVVAGLELLDQRAGLPAEEADRVALALVRRRGADQE